MLLNDYQYQFKIILSTQFFSHKIVMKILLYINRFVWIGCFSFTCKNICFILFLFFFVFVLIIKFYFGFFFCFFFLPPLLQVFCFVVYKFVSVRKMINIFPIINIHEHILKQYVIEKPCTCSELTSAVRMSLHSLIKFNSKLVKIN